MSKTPKSIVEGLTDAVRKTVDLRAAHPLRAVHPTGEKPKPSPVHIGGGPKIVPKPDKPKEGPTAPAGGGSSSK
jgi:hypothetical protein